MEPYKDLDANGLAEIANVLATYLALQADGLRFHVMPNSVLDWFGRTVRGGTKIFDYLRFEVAPQYDHLRFDTAEQCGPIECWPSHMSTKIAPIQEVDYDGNCRNKVTGITSLKLYADSDIEDELGDEIMTLATGNKTPERRHGEPGIAPLTPPSSITKQESEASATESDEDNDQIDYMAKSAKRRKRAYPVTSAAPACSPHSYLRRLPATRTFRRKTGLLAGSHEISALQDSSSEEEEEELLTLEQSAERRYTPLRYMEVTGALRRLRTVNGAQLSQTTSTSTGWERLVRIRISYRIRNLDQQLLFALIIYEHLDGRPRLSRRNLLTEFSQAASNELLSAADADDAVDGTEAPGIPEIMMASIETLPVGLGDEATASLDASMPLLRTPTKLTHTPPATPKRKPRPHHAGTDQNRITWTPPSARPKRHAARSLRL